MNNEIKIMVVEDESVAAMNIKQDLESFGFKVPYIASRADEAVKKALEIRPDLILMDIVLKGKTSGIEAASEIYKLNIPVIYLTAYSDEIKRNKAKFTAPYAYIVKPYDVNELKYAIELALFKSKMEKELKESEEKYRDLVDNSLVGVFKTDLKGDILFANGAMARIFELEGMEEIPSEKSSNFYKDIKKRDELIEKLKEDGSGQFELEMLTKTGKSIYVLISAKLSNQLITGMLIDISPSKEAEKKILEKDTFLKEAQILAEIGSWTYNPQTQMPSWSEGMFRIFGLDPLEGEPNYEQHRNLIHPDDWEMFDKAVQASLDHGKSYKLSLRLKRPDGSIHYIITKSKPIMDNEGHVVELMGVIKDITEQKLAEKQIKKALEEKDVLLREIHHRVKNNLQIISSLLNLQSYTFKDPAFVDILKQNQNRIKSMAMIHEKIYRSPELSHIDFSDYIRSLSDAIFHSYAAIKANVTLKTDMDDNIMLNIETAIPGGLIISELLSNSIKHAFPKNRKGEICVGFKRAGELFTISVRDNGIGFPVELDFRNTESLGLQLVNSLVGQLEGTIELDRSEGTSFKITFKELEYQKRV